MATVSTADTSSDGGASSSFPESTDETTNDSASAVVVERTQWTREVTWTALTIAPWTWFVFRDWTGWFDAVAILLPLLTVLAVIITAAWAWRRRSLRALPVLLSLLVFGFVSVLGPMRPSPTAPPVDGTRFMSANLESYWFSDNDFDWFLETNPTGLVVVSEMQRSHRDDLRARFAHHVDDVIEEEQFRAEPDPADTSYRRYGFPSIGVYSDHALTMLEDTTGITDGMPGMRLQVDLPSGPIVLYALHVPKPALGDGQYQVGLTQQRSMANALADAIRREKLPVVVLGDLNMTDRGGGYRALRDAGLRDGMLAEWGQPTSAKGSWTDLLRLRIDHLLVSEELCTEAPRYDPIAFADHSVMSAVVGSCHDG